MYIWEKNIFLYPQRYLLESLEPVHTSFSMAKEWEDVTQNVSLQQCPGYTSRPPVIIRVLRESELFAWVGERTM